MPVTAVGRGNAIPVLEHARETDGHRLLAGVQMRRSIDLAAQEERLNEVLETAYEPHASVKAEVELDVEPAARLDARREAHSRPPEPIFP